MLQNSMYIYSPRYGVSAERGLEAQATSRHVFWTRRVARVVLGPPEGLSDAKGGGGRVSGQRPH